MDNSNFEVECQRSGVIYVITNKLNGKQYVGQTIQDLKKRLKQHKSCKYTAIGRAIKKYGWENFSVEILEDNITSDELDKREIFWIAKLKCMRPNGYNLTGGGETNKKVSMETRKKISEYNKTKGIKPPLRTGKVPWNKGKKWSEETRKKLSESHIGQPAYWKGKHLPEEVRKKISATLKARNATKKKKILEEEKVND